MRSLLTRLLLVMAVGLLPILTFQTYTEWADRRTRQLLMREEALRLVRMVTTEQQRIVEAAEQVLDVVSDTPAVQDHLLDVCFRLMSNVLARSPRYADIAIVGLDGHTVCGPEPFDRASDFSGSTWFRQALRTAGFVAGDYAENQRTGQKIIHLAKPYNGPDGAIAGVAVISIKLEWLQRQLEQLVLPAGAAASVLDRNAILLARSPDRMRPIGLPILAANRFLLEGGAFSTAEIIDRLGRHRLAGYAPVGEKSFGLAVVVSLDKETTFDAITRANWIGTLLIVAGAALSLLVTGLVGTRLIRAPIAVLLAAARQWRTGDLAARTGLRHDDSEFGKLAAAFDDMAAELEARENILRASEERLCLAIEGARLGVRELDLVENVGHSSPEALRILGREPTGEVNFDQWLAEIHPDDQVNVLAGWGRSLANPGTDIDHEYRFRQPDGGWRWISAHVRVVFEAGQAIRAIGVVQDISQRKQTEAALHESETLFRGIFEQAAIGIAMAQAVPDGVFLRVNPGMCALLGYTSEELVGHGYSEITHPDDLPANHERVRAILAGEVMTYTMEKRYLRRDGGTVWVNVSMALARDTEGKPAYFVGVFGDITERKRADAALKDSETRLRLSQEAGRIGSWDWDLVTNTVHWSELQCRQFGVDPATGDDLVYESWRNAIHHDDLTPTEDRLRTAVIGQTDFEVEYRIVPPGGVRWMHARGHVFRDAGGEAVRMIGIDMDITERRTLENELRASENRFRLLVEGVEDYAIFMLDPEGRVVFWNTGAERIMGWTASEILGQDFSLSFTRDAIDSGRPRELLNIAATDGSVRGEAERVRKDGSRFWAEIAITALYDEKGDVQGYANITHDISERKQAMRDMADSRSRLESVIASAMDAIITVDADQRIVLFNAAAETMFLCPASQALGGRLDQFIPHDCREAHAKYVREFDRTGVTSRTMKTLGTLGGVRRNGEVFPVEASISRARVDGKKLFTVILRDVTERKRAEELQSLLLAELVHRVKNTLAIVHSIASQTRRFAAPEQFHDSFIGRIAALGIAHDLLTRSEWAGATLAEVVRYGIQPYDDLDRVGRCAMDGPVLWLAPNEAVTLTLAFHELATNAARFGALSDLNGKIDVRWKLEPEDKPMTVAIHWREHGGPAVVAPARGGFGSRLLGTAITHELGGETTIEFAPAGVECRFRFPLSPRIRVQP